MQRLPKSRPGFSQAQIMALRRRQPPRNAPQVRVRDARVREAVMLIYTAIATSHRAQPQRTHFEVYLRGPRDVVHGWIPLRLAHLQKGDLPLIARRLRMLLRQRSGNPKVEVTLTRHHVVLQNSFLQVVVDMG